MRILAIRGQNLASLQRPFEIRLDASPLGATGLFAIVGPVGAGKSTLLDALCLPLFDRTPRLSGRGGPAVGDDNQPEGDWLGSNDPRILLRRGAPDGFAEVDFVGRDGVSYRARWRVRRARRKPDGRVQDQELELLELGEGRAVVVASGRKTDVLAAIQLRLGLDFAQFCRSVLLAQGDFAAFLRANAKERAQLLETLTGADVYRALSKAAHEKRRKLQQDRELLVAQMQGQQGLDAEQRAGLEANVAQRRTEIAIAEQGIELAQSYVTWYQQAARHARRESEATVVLQQAQAANAAAEPDRRHLAELQRALPLAGKAALVEDRRERRRRARSAQALAVVALETALHQVTKAQRAVQEKLGPWRSRDDADGLPPLVQELPAWRPLLEQWLFRRRKLATTAQRFAEMAPGKSADPGLLRAEHAAAGQVLAAARTAATSAEFADLGAQQQALEVENAKLVAARAASTVWQRAAIGAEAALARGQAVAAQRVGIVGKLEALLQEQRAAETALVEAQQDERAVTQTELAAQLAEHLHDGEPCPLCGAEEHPAPVHFDAAAAATVRQRVAMARQRFDAAQDAVRAHEKECVRLEAITKDADERVREERERVAEARREFESFVAAPDPAAAAAALAQRQDDLRRRAEALLVVAERAKQAGAAVEVAMQKERRAADLLRAAEDLASLTEDLQVAERALAPAFTGVDDWADELARQGDGVFTGIEALAAAAAALREGRRSLESAQQAVAQAETAVSGIQAELATVESELAAALLAAHVDAGAVETALRLGAAGLADEAARLQGLAGAEGSARAVLQQCTEQRREHERGGRPTIVESDAAAALEDARAARQGLRDALDELQAELSADDLLRRHRALVLPKLDAVEAELRTWVALDELIGSSDGSAFAVFAQSLTLDFLLVEANRRLEELARRYRLQKSTTGELDFVVIDLDLGGARRSLQTLSGGETFLVSLSLALALATLAAPRTRVETLFLDEGFGTLDAQSLEAALGALDSLQATGCQVGVISHVDGIAERIGAVVEVLPEGGGRSRVVVRGD